MKKNVAKYFPESEETQKGHMRGQCQGVRSTRKTELKTYQPIFPTKKRATFSFDLMYADQTGLFPAVLSLGNKYIMILHHVDSNSSWAEAM